MFREYSWNLMKETDIGSQDLETGIDMAGMEDMIAEDMVETEVLETGNDMETEVMETRAYILWHLHFTK